MAKVTIIRPVSQEDFGQKIRVAAYCRVSSDSERQQNSCQAQFEYYGHKFENSETEILVDLYADSGISGLSADNRSEFQRMMQDCRKGRIDRIYTKSISRFARNTRDCLVYIRELKSLGITVCFEKENLDTAKNADEMMLTVMAGLAQEESVSISKNMKWAVRRRMQNGTYKSGRIPYGFEKNDGKIEISENEAETIRQIFEWYLSGYGITAISNMLNENPAFRKKYDWQHPVVRYILLNERYMGDAVFQKNYMTDTVPFIEKKNKGELPMYYVTDANEAIISREDFSEVQKLYHKRTEHIRGKNCNGRYPLSQKVICGFCHSSCKRKIRKDGIFWVCRRHDRSMEYCQGKQMPQERIYEMFIAMFNKLYFGFNEILTPLMTSFRELKMKKYIDNTHVTELQKRSAELKEQMHVLASLRTKGFLSEEKYHEQTANLNWKLILLQKELNRLIKLTDGDEMLEQFEQLYGFFQERSSMMIEFEEETFEFLTESIKVKSENEIEFCILGGLRFTEYYAQK